MTDLRTDSERHADEQAALARQQIGRRGFIGGSDVAAILGISPWGSPWSVWAEKVGLVEPSHSVEHTERMEIGKDAERFLADVFNRHHAKSGVRVIEGQVDLKNDRFPWLRGHADGLIYGTGELEDMGDGGWEAKTAREFTPWDEVPAYYQAQSQVYMMLTGYESWWFTVGFAGWKVKHYVVLADADDQALIAAKTERFWNDNVLAGVPPEVDGSDATTTAIRAAYGHLADADDTLIADPTLSGYCHLLRAAKEDLEHAKGKVAEFENLIKARMADCAVLADEDGTPLVTWKASTTHRLDVHALKADHPDLCEKYMAESVTRRFLVKPSRGE